MRLRVGPGEQALQRQGPDARRDGRERRADGELVPGTASDRASGGRCDLTGRPVVDDGATRWPHRRDVGPEAGDDRALSQPAGRALDDPLDGRGRRRRWSTRRSAPRGPGTARDASVERPALRRHSHRSAGVGRVPDEARHTAPLGYVQAVALGDGAALRDRWRGPSAAPPGTEPVPVAAVVSSPGSRGRTGGGLRMLAHPGRPRVGCGSFDLHLGQPGHGWYGGAGSATGREDGTVDLERALSEEVGGRTRRRRATVGCEDVRLRGPHRSLPGGSVAAAGSGDDGRLGGPHLPLHRAAGPASGSPRPGPGAVRRRAGVREHAGRRRSSARRPAEPLKSCSQAAATQRPESPHRLGRRLTSPPRRSTRCAGSARSGSSRPRAGHPGRAVPRSRAARPRAPAWRVPVTTIPQRVRTSRRLEGRPFRTTPLSAADRVGQG